MKKIKSVLCSKSWLYFLKCLFNSWILQKQFLANIGFCIGATTFLKAMNRFIAVLVDTRYKGMSEFLQFFLYTIINRLCACTYLYPYMVTRLFFSEITVYAHLISWGLSLRYEDVAPGHRTGFCWDRFILMHTCFVQKFFLFCFLLVHLLLEMEEELIVW